MRAVQLTGSIADPEEVGRSGVVSFLLRRPGGRGVCNSSKTRGLSQNGLIKEGLGVLRSGEHTSHCLLVLEREALVGSENVHGLDAAVSVDSDSVHEADGVLHAVHDTFVLFLDGRVEDVAEVPIEGGVQIGQARGQGGTHEVQGRGGVEIGGNQAGWVRLARFGGGFESIDVVATEGGHLDAIDNFSGAGARPRKEMLA